MLSVYCNPWSFSESSGPVSAEGDAKHSVVLLSSVIASFIVLTMQLLH